MTLAATIARTFFLSIAVPAAALAFVSCAASAAPTKQATFASPQEAAEALVAAVRSGDAADIVKVLGPDGRAIASSGDAVADASARERFVAAYDEQNQIRQAGDGPLTLYLGHDDYPFPLPLVSADGKWRFDTAAGAEEILDRRIGENELAAIEVMRAYVDAQREYAETDWDGKGAQYARRLLSRENVKDGLYWPTAEGEPESPLGPLVAEARAEGYRKKRREPEPYHGYLFRVLTAQGPHASGGARTYIVNGRMIGGFALIATPAEYGNSGVKTFVVDQDGVVFEKDLGENTPPAANSIEAFNPESGWSSVSNTK
ncbi:DUF2950 domain-containing protein [Hyphomicrobium sp.]|uniref:DUF2950 domain-containing protein n=1 Tax=Hyphomicrobium sp. TaxID=82 RepID=UPI003F724C7A